MADHDATHDSSTETNDLTPAYVADAAVDVFDALLGSAPGDRVVVETTDGRTFEGELVASEYKTPSDDDFSFIDAPAIQGEFVRDDGHQMKVSQYEDGASIRTATSAHIDSETFVDYRALDGSPSVASVRVESDDDQPENAQSDDVCAECGGVATHVETRAHNSWINEASAYDVFLYECENCGASGKRTGKGQRTGALAAPTEAI